MTLLRLSIRAQGMLSTVLLSLALAACSAAPTSTPLSPKDRSLVPVGKAELQAILPGHYLRGCSGSEPTDSGPLILDRDGRFEKVTGFGNYRGRYEIGDGQVVYIGAQGGEPVKWTDRFFHDAAGRLLIRRGMGGTPSEPHLRVIDEFARDLGCSRKDRGQPRT